MLHVKYLVRLWGYRYERPGPGPLGQEDPLEKEMATHISILAWKIPWTEEPGGPQFMGLQESDMI